MTPLPERGAALRLKAAVEKELAFIPDVERFLEEALRALDEAGPARRPVQAAAVGAAVADAYLLMEKILKQIAQDFEGVPAGAEWHKELLDAATLDIPETRPPILSDATRAALEPLRRFRHVVRNVYGMRIEPERARAEAASVPPALAAFRTDLASFERFLDALAKA